MKYLTPLSYRNSGEGIDLTPVSNLELAGIIARAESLIDSRCTLPSLAPLTIVDEVRRWNGESRRIYPICSPVPIRSITGCRIQVSSNPSTGNPLVATINPNDLVINNTAGYVEVVSFAALTMGLTPVLINLGMNEPLAHLDYVTGYTFAVVDEPLVNSGENTTYYGVRPLWDATLGATVKVNGATAPANTVNLTEGSVVFTTALADSAAVTASYTYRVPDAVRSATIVTVTSLVGESHLNRAGMTNLSYARAGRYYQAGRPLKLSSMTLPELAKELLDPYMHYALDGGT